MSIYDQLGQGPAPMNPMQMLLQIKQNPSAVLRQAGLNIPSGMNNPQQIIQNFDVNISGVSDVEDAAEEFISIVKRDMRMA